MGTILPMPRTKVVGLTPGEMTLARTEAEARQAAIRARGATSNGPANQSIENDMIGVMGEIAFAKWSGLPWVASKGADYDAGGFDVGNCEVRTRRLHTLGLDMTVKSSAQFKYKPDRIYVLAWASPNSKNVRLVGYTTLGFIVDYGHYRHDWDAYVLGWKLLVDLEELNAKR
jgi:hypothetical protein